jgi:hypothetical protein
MTVLAHIPQYPLVMKTLFTPQEVAYRVPGKTWQRRVCKTARAFDALIAKLNEQGAEILTRDAEVSK